MIELQLYKSVIRNVNGKNNFESCVFKGERRVIRWLAVITRKRKEKEKKCFKWSGGEKKKKEKYSLSSVSFPPHEHDPHLIINIAWTNAPLLPVASANKRDDNDRFAGAKEVVDFEERADVGWNRSVGTIYHAAVASIVLLVLRYDS